ncbi:hypothetical protein MCG98_04440 [Ruminococcus sp. OA3]|uniref:hypothetical protein n=1 Tax=Ruminococcus sp. OA3 TaxID=2914164 RepID=UPI001F059C92|nr:hypothetical protein [Ruminococcus sp. OA3]MCH1981818.1 hypothetical protein [Ruminococcus sp. OA3]
MKTGKVFTVTAVTVLLSMTLLTGCGDNSREKALEDQVSQLEQQVTDLQNSQNTKNDTEDGKNSADNSATDNTDDGNATAGDVAKTGDDPANSVSQDTKTVPSLEELSQSVSAVTDKVNGTTPTGTSDEQLAQYRTLKREIDSVDRDLDYRDDDIEDQFEQGTITREEYRAADRQIDALEDQLDEAEDNLEHLFGIDD